MLKSITIHALRKLAGLKFEGLKRVNVVVGPNGAGKTTVMEAVGMIGSPAGPGFMGMMSVWRDMPAASLQVDYALRSYFPGLKVDAEVGVGFETAEGMHEIRLRAIKGAGVLHAAAGSAKAQGLVDRELNGVELEYTLPGADAKKFVSTATLVYQGLEERRHNEVKGLGTFVVHARRSSSVGETAGAITFLRQQKKEELFLAAAQRLDGRVKRLLPALVGESVPVILADVGGERLMPIGTLGDGFGRGLLIATACVYPGSRLVAIDEIDSGLSGEVRSGMWRSVDELSSAFGTQIFCSVSDETGLAAAQAAIGADLNVIRL